MATTGLVQAVREEKMVFIGYMSSCLNKAGISTVPEGGC